MDSPPPSLIFKKIQIAISNLSALFSSGRDWPDARGTWYNYDRNLIAFVNECEDQLKIISVQAGGNVKETFERFCNALAKLEKSIKKQGHEWMWNSHLGFVTSCPSNLGTALRASVFIRLPLLSQVRITFFQCIIVLITHRNIVRLLFFHMWKWTSTVLSRHVESL